MRDDTSKWITTYPVNRSGEQIGIILCADTQYAHSYSFEYIPDIKSVTEIIGTYKDENSNVVNLALEELVFSGKFPCNLGAFYAGMGEKFDSDKTNKWGRWRYNNAYGGKIGEKYFIQRARVLLGLDPSNVFKIHSTFYSSAHFAPADLALRVINNTNGDHCLSVAQYMNKETWIQSKQGWGELGFPHGHRAVQLQGTKITVCKRAVNSSNVCAVMKKVDTCYGGGGSMCSEISPDLVLFHATML